MSVTRVNGSSISASGVTASPFGTTLGVACLAGDVIVVTADCNGTHAANGMSVQETTNGQTFTTISETQQGGASSRWEQTFLLKTTVDLTGSETIQLTPYASNTSASFVVDIYRGLTGLISRAVQITSGAAGLSAANPALLSAPPAGDLVLSLTGVSSGTATKPAAYTLGSQTTAGPTTSNAHVLSADGTSTYGGTWTWGTSNSSALQTLALQSTAPVFESRTNLTGANGASAVITYPASIAAGDILIVHIYKENTAAVTPPDGTWTLKGSTTTTAPQHHLVFWKRAAGGETGTVTFSWTGSVFRSTTCERYSNCAGSGDPIEAIAFNQTNSNVTTLNVSLAATSPDSMLIWSGTSFTGGNTWTTPTGYTNLANLDVLGAANKRNPAGGATGNVTGTANISGPMTSALLSLLGSAAVVTSVPLQGRPRANPIHPGKTPGRRMRFRIDVTQHLAYDTTPTVEAHAGDSQLDQRTTTDTDASRTTTGTARTDQRTTSSAPAQRGATGAGAVTSRDTTSATTVKKATGAAIGSVRSQTSSTGIKATSSTGVVTQRSVTASAGTGAAPKAGVTSQRATTSSTGTKKIAVATGQIQARTTTSASGARSGSAASSIYQRTTTAVTVLKTGTGAVSGSQRSSTASTGRKSGTGTGVTSQRDVTSSAGTKARSQGTATYQRSVVISSSQPTAPSNATSRVTTSSTGRKGATPLITVTCRTSTGSTGTHRGTGTGLSVTRDTTSSTGRRSGLGAAQTVQRSNTRPSGSRGVTGAARVTQRVTTAYSSVRGASGAGRVHQRSYTVMASGGAQTDLRIHLRGREPRTNLAGRRGSTIVAGLQPDTTTSGREPPNRVTGGRRAGRQSGNEEGTQ